MERRYPLSSTNVLWKVFCIHVTLHKNIYCLSVVAAANLSFLSAGRLRILTGKNHPQISLLRLRKV